MQAGSSHIRLSVEVDTCELEGFEDLLRRLKGLREPALLPLYSYEEHTIATGVLYYLDVDEHGESLRDFALRIRTGSEPPFSPNDLVKIAISCVQALGIFHELGILIPGLDLGVIYISELREIRVNVIEAYFEKSSDSVANILAKCVFLKEDCSDEEMQTLPRYVTAEFSDVIEQLLLPNPAYALLAQSFHQDFPRKQAIQTTYCLYCHESKPSSILQICDRHYFCSNECLNSMQVSVGKDKAMCPLCSVKVSRKPGLHIKQKPPNETRKCGNCSRDFELNLNELWRQENQEKASLSDFCSINCFQIHLNPPIPQAVPMNKDILAYSPHMQSYACLVCEQMSPIEGTLHCGAHGLCSEECRQRYYLYGNLEENSYQGTLICYNCLETYLKDIERIAGAEELECLATKLMQRQEAIAKQKPRRLQEVIQCGFSLSLKALPKHYFRLLCLFCGDNIVANKDFSPEFAINDTTPFLLSCELQVHGVCSTRCLRLNLPRNSIQTIRCPKCPNALVVTESIQIALNHRNPTLECMRRTPYLDLCKVDCGFTYSQKPCRHEFCGHVMDRYLASNSADLAISCCICGSSSPYEEVYATGSEIAVVKEEI